MSAPSVPPDDSAHTDQIPFDPAAPTGGGAGPTDGGGGPGGGGPTGGPAPFGPGPFGPIQPPPAPIRRLRRSKNDRVAAGLCGGLGRYFGVDPVIFRVVLAVLVLFGGSGIVIYLLGWLAIPDEDAANAPIDRIVYKLRRRSLPAVIFGAIVVLLVWLAVFSWWAPFSIFPAVLVIVALVVLLGRRDRRTTEQADYLSTAGGDPHQGFDAPLASLDAPLDPASVQLRSWYDQTKARSRQRRRRSAPLRWTTFGLVVASVAGLAVADAVHGIPFGTYFWVIGGITVAGLLVGLLARRTPWVVGIFLIPALIGVTSFGTSEASAHDGFGDRRWIPSSSSDVRDEYRLGFGRSTLDLAGVTSIGANESVKLVQGAGQVRLLIPRDLPVRINADLHQGEVELNGESRDNGWNVEAVYATPAAAGASSVLTIDVELTAGQLNITYV